MDDVEVDERRQREGGGHLDVLRHQQQLPPVATIGDHAADQRQEEDRHFAEKRIEAEVERRS